MIGLDIRAVGRIRYDMRWMIAYKYILIGPLSKYRDSGLDDDEVSEPHMRIIVH
jgi:hypothetical protein